MTLNKSSGSLRTESPDSEPDHLQTGFKVELLTDLVAGVSFVFPLLLLLLPPLLLLPTTLILLKMIGLIELIQVFTTTYDGVKCETLDWDQILPASLLFLCTCSTNVLINNMKI